MWFFGVDFVGIMYYDECWFYIYKYLWCEENEILMDLFEGFLLVIVVCYEMDYDLLCMVLLVLSGMVIGVGYLKDVVMLLVFV